MTEPEAVVTIGTASARPGELAHGELRVLELPTGGWETLPIIIARGAQGAGGPVLWLTANIHGAELTGIAVIHRVMTAALVERLHGTVVAVPSLNPTGLLAATRAPQYAGDDPNRLWPDTRQNRGTGAEPYERVALRVHEELRRHGDFLLDLHNASLRSVPFTIVDRVLYHARPPDARQRAELLAERLRGMANAFGLPVVNESVPVEYVKLALHRSVSGAAVNALSLPALTVELGLTGALDPAMVDLGVAGVRNVLRWAGMLAGEVAGSASRTPLVDFLTRRDDSVRAPRAGLVAPLIDPGDHFRAGEPLGRMVDLWGRALDGGELVAPADGWLIGWRDGLARYAGQRVASLAIRDEAPLVAPAP